MYRERPALPDKFWSGRCPAFGHGNGETKKRQNRIIPLSSIVPQQKKTCGTLLSMHFAMVALLELRYFTLSKVWVSEVLWLLWAVMSDLSAPACPFSMVSALTD